MKNKLKILIYFFLIITNNLSFHPQNVSAKYELLTLKPSRIHFPGINNYKFQGGIYYYPTQKQFRYVSSTYDPEGRRIIEKIHNEFGKIIQIVKYTYDNKGYLIQEELYNQYQELIKKIHYKSNHNINSDKNLQEIHILNEENQKFHIEYHYSYNHNHQLINEIEYIYDISKSSSKNNHCLQINSIIYTYLDNKKIAEYYSKAPKEEEYYFQYAEIYEYIYPEKIHRVIYLSKQKNITKVIEYNYDEKFRIKKVSIFKPKSVKKWRGALKHQFYKDFEQQYYILYEYDEANFSKIAQSNFKQEKKFKEKEIKFRTIQNLQSTEKNYGIFKTEKKKLKTNILVKKENPEKPILPEKNPPDKKITEDKNIFETKK